MKIKELSRYDKPIEKLLKYGKENLTDAELFAIILRTGNKKENVVELSKRILSRYNLIELLNKDVKELINFHGIGLVKSSQIVSCLELGKRLNMKNKNIIRSCEDVLDIVKPYFLNANKEYFLCIYLDSSNNILNKEIIATGTESATLIDMKSLLKRIILEQASSIILVHNHPSGIIKPTDDDIKITKKIKSLCSLIDVDLLDHLIIHDNKFFSMKRNNIL